MKRVVILLAIFATFIYSAGFPSWYYKIKSVKKEKEAFVKIMLPLIRNANKKTLNEREFVIKFFKNFEKNGLSSVDKNDLKKLAKLAKKYKIENLYDKYEYLLKIDKVPESLALTQAAIESAWGKSRFARYANNLFGLWTYNGKGLVPERREIGKRHKLRVFKSLQASVDSYLLNLNRHEAYKNFRLLRYQTRVLGETFSGKDAAKTLSKYSELREKYIKMVKNFMIKNGFLKYDTEFDTDNEDDEIANTLYYALN